jgi:hypothetical protein
MHIVEAMQNGGSLLIRGAAIYDEYSFLSARILHVLVLITVQRGY